MELHRIADKLEDDYAHLENILFPTRDLSDDEVLLALSIAKRLRNRTTELIRELATRRDSG